MKPASLLCTVAVLGALSASAIAAEPASTVPAFETGAPGVGAFVDPVADLPFKKEFNTNSWFAIGHFEKDGHKLNYLFHMMILGYGDKDTMLQTVVAITDETSGWYKGNDTIMPLSKAQFADGKLSIKSPNGLIEGDFNDMRIVAEIEGGKVDLKLKAASPVLFNGGTGVFPLLGMSIHEYSVPNMATTGALVVDGKSYDVSGPTWFDRQFQVQATQPGAGLGGDWKWSWMDINLDNGDAISLWSAYDANFKRDLAWATILHPDGTQTTTAVEPLSKSQRDLWASKASGNTYPTKWTVRIPQYDAVLEVTPSPREQEVVSQFPPLNKYEGASSFEGTYKGKPAKGFGYVELVGTWKK